MGADAYWYYVAYDDDRNDALQKLRQREFEAGRYYPVTTLFGDDFREDYAAAAPAPGRQHDAIEEIFEDAQEMGTCSILDLFEAGAGDGPGIAHVMEPDELLECFGTDQPTRDDIDRGIGTYWGKVGGVRGRGVCAPVYDGGRPVELFFMGYTWD